MNLLFGHDEIVARFIGEKLGVQFIPPFVSIGVLDKSGALVGGGVFNNFNGANIEVTAYGPGAMRRRILKAGFLYAFKQLGVLRLSARTKRSNKLMRALLPRLGFEYEATLKNYFGPTRGDDAMVFRMMRADAARWIGE